MLLEMHKHGVSFETGIQSGKIYKQGAQEMIFSLSAVPMCLTEIDPTDLLRTSGHSFQEIRILSRHQKESESNFVLSLLF